MKDYRWLLFGLLLLLGSVAHAEGNCPPGYYPIGAPPGQGGPQGCAPIPGDSNTQQQAQPQQPLPQLWVDRWGAIATYEPGGVLGVSTNMSNESKAKKSAMADCQAKGGGSNCKFQISYRNGCAVLLVGDKFFNASSGATIEEATRSGMKICTANGNTNCHAYYTACSLPVRIQ